MTTNSESAAQRRGFAWWAGFVYGFVIWCFILVPPLAYVVWRLA